MRNKTEGKFYNAHLDEALKGISDVQRVEILSRVLLEVFGCLDVHKTAHLEAALVERGLPDSVAKMTIILEYLCDTIGCRDVLNENLESILKKSISH